MELLDSQKNWDELGKEDPLWVVLTQPEKKGGKWDVSEFFATGKTEIAQVLQQVATLGKVIRYEKVLDFGCGVGRLSQALAVYFDEVHGVDISPSMIEHARKFNAFGSKCIFHINSQSDLQLFEDNYFDFVYSNIALQHIEPEYSIKYIEDFVRVLKPGGMAVFQVRSATWLRRIFPEFISEQYRRLKFKNKPVIGIFGLPERKVIRTVEKAGGKIVQLRREKEAELSVRWRWVNLHFVIIKSTAF